jgi:glucose/arabinose dehydrogenase
MQIRALSAWLVLALSLPAAAQAWQLPAHFQAVSVPGTYSLPVNLVFTADGSLFVVQKAGLVRLLDPNGNDQGLPFIDLVAEVNNNGDRGLLALALQPGWVPDGGPNSWVYLLYTVSPVPPNDNGYNTNQQYSFSRLTRYHAITTSGKVVADLASRQILLGHQQPDGSVPDCIASVHDSHSNGRLIFAPDGTLLLSCGDGAHYDFKDIGGHDAPGFDNWTHPVTGLKGPTPIIQDAGALRSQDLRSLSGKVLRLDPATGFGIPSNPFFDGDPASNASRVWAMGLRNPFRMTLAPNTGASNPAAGQPGVLVIGDVGWNTWEEVNVSRFGGENFGWPCYEGFPTQSNYQNYFPTDPSKVDCHDAVTGVHTDPILAWNHGAANLLAPAGIYVDENGVPQGGFSGNCSIGGTLYEGPSYPAKYVGRLFFADYVRAWVKTIQFDGSWNAVAVRDFASGTGGLSDIETNPVNGDLYAADVVGGRLWHIVYGANAAPIAVASASPTHGPAPLTVNFTGSASHDPDAGDTLTYDWDFGDGTPHATTADTTHTYLVDDLYQAHLVVTDGLGATGDTFVPVAVGNGPPVVTIAQPLMGQTYSVPVTLPLSGSAQDPDNDPVQLTWTVDLYHSTHVHPAVATFTGPQASLDIATSPEDDELLYYRITLTGTDPGGLTGSAHVFVYPSARLTDIAGTQRPISHVGELSPPNPTGGGNPDIEVIRDAVFPPVGSDDSSQQYDTYHGGAQGDDDWIGYELTAPPGPEFRFTGFTFQEGKDFYDGGWWKDLRVEVRNAGAWSIAPNLHIAPDYPFALAGQPYFDGVTFQTYTLEFDPAAGDAVRLRGTPGGTAHFMSVGELRCRSLAAAQPSPWHDITADAATILSKVDTLSPAGPFGGGNKNKETIRNGTFPPVGSLSLFAQYDTFHNGDQAGEDWIGYDFGATRTFSRLLFQEGRNNLDGGAFTALEVQVQASAGGPWTTLPGVTSTPPYSGLNGVNYESFDLQFAPVLARAIRLHGPPAGGNAYISVGELRVFEPALAAGCGWTAYGTGLPGANTLQLASATPPGLGLPIEVRATGAQGPCSGLLLLGFGPASVPLLGGTLLVEPSTMLLLPLGFDAAGTLTLLGTLPSDPGLQGVTGWLQAVAFQQPAPWHARFSNGLQLTLCAP